MSNRNQNPILNQSPSRIRSLNPSQILTHLSRSPARSQSQNLPNQIPNPIPSRIQNRLSRNLNRNQSQNLPNQNPSPSLNQIQNLIQSQIPHPSLNPNRWS